MVTPLWALNTIKNLCSPKKLTRVHQNCLRDAIQQAPCQILWRSVKKNAKDIHDRKFLLAKSVGQSSPNFFRGCYPLRPPIMPNFIEIGQTSLEKSVKKRYLFGPSGHFFVMDGQKRDYLSRVSQRARGATNEKYFSLLGMLAERAICFTSSLRCP